MGHKPSTFPFNLWTATIVIDLFFCHWNLANAAELYPFGIFTNSERFPADDDLVVSRNISQPVKVAGEMYQSIHVNINGVVCWGTCHFDTPQDSLLNTTGVFVAGLWADINTEEKGQIWLDTVENTTGTLTSLESEVRLLDTYFNAGWANIITFYKVPAFETSFYPGENSFQIILVADTTREKTFAIVNVEDFEWTSDTMVSGFNYGDGAHHVDLLGSTPFDKDKVLQGSNVGIRGKHILKIDSILKPCNDTVAPRLSIDGGASLPANATTLLLDTYSSAIGCSNGMAAGGRSSSTDFHLVLQCGDAVTGTWDDQTHTSTVRLGFAWDWLGTTCRCVAQASGYESCSTSATIDVRGKPVITKYEVDEQTDMVDVEPGTRVGFQCDAKGGNPGPSVKVVELLSQRVISDASENPSTIGFQKDIRCGDMGKYVCVAENEHGSNQTEYIEIRAKCLNLLTPVEETTVNTDYVTSVSFHISANPKPNSYKLTKKQTRAPDRMIDSTAYLVTYTRADDDVMWEGRVQLDFADFRLAESNQYTFSIGNGVSQELSVNFTTVKSPLFDEMKTERLKDKHAAKSARSRAKIQDSTTHFYVMTY